MTIFVDFNDHNGRYLFLQSNGTKDDLRKFGIVLQEELVLRVSDGDLAATGTIKWSSEFSQWVICVDPEDTSTFMNLHECADDFSLRSALEQG